MTALRIDAEALYAELRNAVQHQLQPDTALVGIWSGGAWLAERLKQELCPQAPLGVVSSALHRDDFGERGLSGGADATRLPFAVDGRPILLIDDVLYTGRTIRAVINELFDFGRPASIRLCVLVDRGGRELPIEPSFAAAKVVLPQEQRLSLRRADDGRFSFRLEEQS